MFTFLNHRLLCQVNRHTINTEEREKNSNFEDDALLLRIGVVLTAIASWPDFIVGKNSTNIFFQSHLSYVGPDGSFQFGEWDREVFAVEAFNTQEPRPPRGSFSPLVLDLYLRALEAICKHKVYIDSFALPFLATILQVLNGGNHGNMVVLITCIATCLKLYKLPKGMIFLFLRFITDSNAFGYCILIGAWALMSTSPRGPIATSHT